MLPLALALAGLFGTLAACSLEKAANASPNPNEEQASLTNPSKALPATGKVNLDEKTWKKRLTAEQFYVLRKAGTERAFTGAYWDEKRPGTFVCAGCGQVLFETKDKFKSGTGWPSFTQPAGLDPKEPVVEIVEDRAFGMVRKEVRCARCGGHLGHVFDDGPAPTGERYCINSAALKFQPKASAPKTSNKTAPAAKPSSKTHKATH